MEKLQKGHHQDTQWITTRSRGITRKGVGKICAIILLLLLTCQVQARSSIVGNSLSTVDAQLAFKSTFNSLTNEYYSIRFDIGRYQSALEHALSKVDFSIGTGIYMLPKNLKLNIRKASQSKRWME